MKKILAFAGSTSSTSINEQLVTFTAKSLKDTSFDIIDLNDFSLPVFSVDKEKDGFPENAKKFNNLLDNYDGFIISLAEHNGSYTAAFKNIFDWISRINIKIFREKPMLLMATSPGARGGASVLASANSYFPKVGAEITAIFSLPKFYDNFKNEKIVDDELKSELENLVINFEKAL